MTATVSDAVQCDNATTTTYTTANATTIRGRWVARSMYAKRIRAADRMVGALAAGALWVCGTAEAAAVSTLHESVAVAVAVARCAVAGIVVMRYHLPANAKYRTRVIDRHRV